MNYTANIHKGSLTMKKVGLNIQETKILSFWQLENYKPQ